MLAYHNDQNIKSRFIEEITKHEVQDRIISGTYGDVNDGVFKGCAVGCSINSMNIINGALLKTNDHGLYESLLGIPRILARLEDNIFESLPVDLQKTWPRRFAEAINAGTDLSSVWPRLAVWMMTDPVHGVIVKSKNERTKSSIQMVSNLYGSGDFRDKNKCLQVKEYAAAAYAADADAYAAAAYAADAYAAAAYADAADAADAAAYADAAAAYDADAAAYAADAAAAYDAAYADRKIYRIAQSEKLLELLASAE